MALVLPLRRTPVLPSVVASMETAAALNQIASILQQASDASLSLEAARAALAPHQGTLQEMADRGILPQVTSPLLSMARDQTTLGPADFRELAGRMHGLVKLTALDRFEAGADPGARLAVVTGPLERPRRKDPRFATTTQIKPAGEEHKVFCAVCSKAGEASHKFCGDCGAPLLSEAPVSLANFCTDCGQPLPARSGEFAADNRVVTMVFTDLKGFSSFSEKLPPDALFSVMQEIQEGLAAAVTAEGGYISGYWGDAIFAIFGAPKSREDDPVRAVRAALRMQDFIKTWSLGREARGEPGLQLRVGINTGQVAWGLYGGPGKKSHTAIGNAVNIAARMEPAAPPGGIAITQATVDRLQGRFAVTPRGVITVKNIREPIEYYELTRELPSLHHASPRGVEQVRFVGRDDDLSLVRQAFDATVADGKARIEMVAAEAGLGKSRLASEFLASLSETPVHVLTARGDDLQSQTPFRAIAVAFDQLFGLDSEDTTESISLKIRSRLAGLLPVDDDVLEKHVHLLGNLVGVAFEDPPANVQYILSNAIELRERTLDSIVAVCEALSKRSPLVLVLEDCHWMDRGSLRYIQMILERLKDKPVFALGLTRPRFADEVPPLLGPDRPYRIHRHDLTRLPESVIRSMISGMLSDETPSINHDFIVSQSDGNPYLAQEMARAVREGFRVVHDLAAGAMRFADNSGKSVPPGSHAFLQARVDVLPPASKRILQTASVFSHGFSTADIRGIDPTVSDTMLQALVQRKALFRLEDGSYQFPHALLRDTVYEGIPQSEKIRLHRARAWALTRESSDEFGLIASHLERAGERELASSSYLKAGKAAYDKGANITAVELCRRAHELSSQAETRLNALIQWNDALYADRKFADELLLIPLIDASLAELTHPNPELTAKSYFHKALAYYMTGDTTQAESELNRGLSSLGTMADSPARCRIFNLLGTIFWQNGNLIKSEECFQNALTSAQLIDHSPLIAMAYNNLSLIGSTKGNFSLAKEMSRHAVEHNKKAKEQRGLVSAMNNQAWACLSVGDYEAALGIYEEAIQLSREVLENYNLPTLLASYGTTLRRMGRNSQAIAALQEALTFYKDETQAYWKSVTMYYLATSCMDESDLDAADRYANEACAIARKLGDKSLEAKSLLVLAGLSETRRQYSEALEHISSAADMIDQPGFMTDSDLEILLAKARLLRRAGAYGDAWVTINKAKTRLQERASQITAEADHQSFLNRITVHREIPILWETLHEISRTDTVRPVDHFLADLDYGILPAPPSDFRFIRQGEPGQIARHDGDDESAAGTILHRSLPATVRALLSTDLVIPRNDGEVRGVWAKDIRWETVFDRENTPHIVLEWSLAARAGIGRILFPFVQQPAHYHHLLRVSRRMQHGIVYLTFEETPENHLTAHDGREIVIPQKLRVPSGQFGRLEFQIASLAEDQTLVRFSMKKALFTQNPWVILEHLCARILA